MLNHRAQLNIISQFVSVCGSIGHGFYWLRVSSRPNSNGPNHCVPTPMGMSIPMGIHDGLSCSVLVPHKRNGPVKRRHNGPGQQHSATVKHGQRHNGLGQRQHNGLEQRLRWSCGQPLAYVWRWSCAREQQLVCERRHCCAQRWSFGATPTLECVRRSFRLQQRLAHVRTLCTSTGRHGAPSCWEQQQRRPTKQTKLPM